MGERIALGLVAVAVACGLSGAAAPVQAGPAHAGHPIGPDVADRIVAGTSSALPDHKDSKWADCGLPMNIDYAVGPGVDPADVGAALEYPIRYLRDLGYTASLGRRVDFVPNLSTPTTPGAVLVIAAKDRDQMAILSKYPDYLAGTNYGPAWPKVSSASIEVDAAGGGLNSETLLHELGHVLGLGHKGGTVMRESLSAGGSQGFDAAEMAAIDCRS